MEENIDVKYDCVGITYTSMNTEEGIDTDHELQTLLKECANYLKTQDGRNICNTSPQSNRILYDPLSSFDDKEFYIYNLMQNIGSKEKCETPNTKNVANILNPEKENPTLFYKFKRTIKRLRDNMKYRRKFTYSVSLIWAFLVLGWRLGQIGPSLLDLKVITGVSFERMSLYVTSLCAGYMCGGVFGGVVYDKMNKLLLLCCVLSTLSATITLQPWCLTFESMLLAQFIEGLCCGCIDTVSCAETVSLWDTKTGQSFMQALHLGFGCGGIISPLITAPFLVDENLTPDGAASGVLDVHTQNDTATYINVTYALHLNSTNGAVSMLYGAYTITGAITLLASFPFLLMFFKFDGNFERHKTRAEKESSRSLPLCLKIGVVVLMASMSALCTGLEETLVEFLSAFCVKHMKWTKTQGSFLTSLYFGSVAIGPLINIFMVRIFNQIYLLGAYCILLVAMLSGMTISAAHGFHPGIWVSPPLIGLVLAVIFPIVFTWTEDVFMPVTGKISSIFIFSGAFGSMLNPTILGKLMDDVTPMWYCYLLLIESVVMFCFYLIALSMTKIVISKYTRPPIEQEIRITFVPE